MNVPESELSTLSWAFEQGYKMGLSDAKEGIFADISETVNGFVESIEDIENGTAAYYRKAE